MDAGHGVLGQEYATALDRVREARDAYWTTRRLIIWASSPQRPFSQAAPPRLPALRHPATNGEPVAADIFWDALDTEVRQPETTRQPIRYDQERYRDVRNGILVEEGFRTVAVYADEPDPANNPGLILAGALVLTEDLDGS